MFLTNWPLCFIKHGRPKPNFVTEFSPSFRWFCHSLYAFCLLRQRASSRIVRKIRSFLTRDCPAVLPPAFLSSVRQSSSFKLVLHPQHFERDGRPGRHFATTAFGVRIYNIANVSNTKMKCVANFYQYFLMTWFCHCPHSNCSF